jgi:cobalt-zinc-cadmium efflux system outer membrane protein
MAQAGNFQPVQKVVRDRSGAEVRWEQQISDQERTAAIVARLVKKPLSLASAVQIALLNNRDLQATFGEIGIAQSDVIEAVTVPNPSVDFDVQFPAAAASASRYGWLVAQEFVQILTTPLRKKIALEQMEAAQLRIAAQTLELVAEVKTAYFTTQADQQLLARLKMVQETNAAALNLAQRQFQAGNTTEFALLQSQSSYSQGRLDLLKAETDLRSQREELTRLLGLWGEDTDWEIKGDILPIPDRDFNSKELESLAIAQRLDLQAAHRNLTSLVSALGLTKSLRWVPLLSVGFSGEKDVDGALNLGPSISLEIPIFNHGQSRMVRGEAQISMAENKLEALAVDIRSRVRELRDRVLSLSETAKFYHDELLPLRIRMVNQAILEYNAMQFSPYELFLTKSQELEAERGYIDALRGYWVARAQLEQEVGGSLNPISRPAHRPNSRHSANQKQQQ